MDCKKITFEGKTKTLLAEYENFFPQPLSFENEIGVVMVIGSPIYANAKVDAKKTAESLIKNFPSKTALDLLDGEFLLIHFVKDDGSLRIINDRWCSVPFHYNFSKEKKIFCASPCFLSVWEFLKDNMMLKIDQKAFFELLWFQRLFGTKTLAKGTYFMPDAHVLTIKDWEICAERYWQRSYDKNKNSIESNAQELAGLVKHSISVKTADAKRLGHFLSGGMDSRSVLAGFEGELPTCFTVGVSDNREVRTARKLAVTKGAEHHFLKLHPEHYGKIRESAVKICGGMFNYDHALFLGYQDFISQKAEVCFNGYGFDFMFQGMYIPAKNMTFAGRNLYLRKMHPPPDKLVEYFINNASYRIKLADIWRFVREDKKHELKEFQINSISEILKQGHDLTDNKFDLWEYFTFHHLSRHYSYPNVLSIKTFSESRIASFTNQIFDLYLSLPTAQRFEGRIEKRLLQILDENLAKIPSANTGFPITASGLEQTAYQICRGIKRRISGAKDFESWTERTWPSREYALKNQKSLNTAAREIIRSDLLEQLGFLDIGKIRRELPRWLQGEKVDGVSGDLVQTLVTIGTFLQIK
ncbi:MAG TPA: asparagine synthase-related protein [Victivallales bacterium]|nr:asparagine synthase-related protein [Victivallales bacterium]